VSEIEVHNAVEDIMTERARWTAAALGRRVDLTFEEQILFGIRTIACVDRTKRMMRLYFRERKRDRDRRRINEMRARIPTNSISLRARELTAVLNDEWTESRALGALMQKRWKLKRDAMEKAVHRASQELCDASIAERKYGSGSRGSRVLFLRLKKPMNVDVSEYRGARNTDEIRLLRRSDSKLSGRHCRADKNESTSPKKFNKTGHKSRGPRALKMESPHRLLVYGDSQKMAPLQSGWPSERGRKDGRAPQRRTRQAASEEGRMPPVGGNRPMRRSTGTVVNMIVTESNIVTDEGGHILAGPFASMRQHWRWMDLNTNKGLAHQDQFNRIGRAFDGQTIEGLGRPRSDPTDATSLTVIVDE
jgi:hypothetical protein